jgi:nitrogen-specific signal transduction histidine kinase
MNGEAFDPAKLVEQLHGSLSRQREFYRQISALQSALLERLDHTAEMQPIMEMLAQKNALLDSIRAENRDAAPWVEEWVSRKAECADHPLYGQVGEIVSEIETLVLELRSQDEQMIKRFDRASQSQNMLNAFRALR